MCLVYVFTFVCVRAWSSEMMVIAMDVCVCVRKCVCACVCVQTYMCACVCDHVCVCSLVHLVDVRA